MVKVVLHEVNVCNYFIMILLVCYDANALDEVKQDM